MKTAFGVMLFLALASCKCTPGSRGLAKIVATHQIASFRTALDKYRADTGRFPAQSEGLHELFAKRYLPQEIPPDPWGRNYIYKYPGAHGDSPDVISLGADGKPGGTGLDKDIVSWEQ